MNPLLFLLPISTLSSPQVVNVEESGEDEVSSIPGGGEEPGNMSSVEEEVDLGKKVGPLSMAFREEAILSLQKPSKKGRTVDGTLPDYSSVDSNVDVESCYSSAEEVKSLRRVVPFLEIAKTVDKVWIEVCKHGNKVHFPKNFLDLTN